jgi:hypothetical protein
MDCDDLSNEDLEREANACDADPTNAMKHCMYTVHVRQQMERLKQFVDEVISTTTMTGVRLAGARRLRDLRFAFSAVAVIER